MGKAAEFAKTVDFGLTAGDYARHRAGFPPSFFERMREQGIGAPGQRVLDLGTGTGVLGRGFAVAGSEVTGVDISAPMMEQAKKLDREAGLASRYHVARAEETGLPVASFDVVTAGQCWHWFDGARAAAEARRVLRPGGRAVIAHFDWLPLPGSVVAMSEQLILKHNPAWPFANGNGVHPRRLVDLAGAGFTQIESFSYDEDIPYSHEGWRGRIRASAGVSATLAPEKVAVFDAEHADLIARDFPAEPLAVPHRIFVVIGVNKKKGSDSFFPQVPSHQPQT